MAAPLIPAAQKVGSAVAKNLPALLNAVKENAPAAYDAVKATIGSSGRSLDKVVSLAARRNDAPTAAAVVEELMRNGVPAGMIATHVPSLTMSELREFQNRFLQIEQQEMAALNDSPELSGDPVMVATHAEVEIEFACRTLKVSSDELVRIASLIRLGPLEKRVEKYKAMKILRGERPL